VTATTTRAAETWAHILAQPDGYPMGVAADWLQEHDDHDGSAEAKADACDAVEAVAQQHLDAHPDDHKARRLLGEWLQWHGDERGDGYRALAACKREPYAHDGFLWWNADMFTTFAKADLPGYWWALLGAVATWVNIMYPTRLTAEDAAALTFARLPAERREQLLKGEM
jgi:hypothetical protein